MSSVESLPNPKQTFYDLLRTAGGQISHRKKFAPDRMVHRVADLINSFEPLRQSSSFNRFEGKLVAELKKQHWTIS